MPHESVTAYVALGGNLGDRLAHLRTAVRALGETAGVQDVVASPIFETAAVADEPQPDYLNAVVRLTTTLTARQLLDRCLEIEATQGRVRATDGRKASRTIDLDVLLYGNETHADAALTVPHPQLLARPFVRVPLAAVASPGLRHPVTGESLGEAAPSPDVRLRLERWL